MVRGRAAVSRKYQLMGDVVRVDEKSILVRAHTAPKLASKAFDSRGRLIGYVSNVFGPVATPYVKVKMAEGLAVREGEPVYTEAV
ncbi:MAG: hypothetical protein NZ570_02135 [Candidatus Caldarchaeum sp.]|nr:hypothetical protein [Candidatus Caldarchaeum sp.]MCS7137460.1 hypothetical protein [Candidatus Caldarchaeum sp.]MDW7977809.1 hypothetical protein [Candidatus Caldarchaeum sp.]MDW8359989.1 hypothetical protein [Candidatus Caldarchaeum sp.]